MSDRLLVRWYRLGDRFATWRERPAHARSRRDTVWRTAAFVAVVCALLAVPMLMLLSAGSDTPVPSSDESRRPAPSPQVAGGPEASVPGSQLPGFGVHVNEEAGYLFSYPDTWTVSNDDETTHLVDPNGDIEMTFGIAPSRTLEAASDRVVAEVADGYSDVTLVSGEFERTLQGQRSLVVGGRGTDPAGDAVRFVVITIRGTDQTRAITVRFAGSDPLESLRVIQEIVASFRTSDTA